MPVRNPVVISSLEEDLREMGLLDEEETPDAAEPDAAEPAQGADGKPLDEKRIMKQVRVSHGKAKRVRTQRTSAHAKAYGRAYKRRKKSIIKKKASRSGVIRRAARRDKIRSRLKREGTDTIANLLENVQDILAGIQGNDGAPQEIEVTAEDTVKTFANLAMIAEMLADAFDTFSEQDDLSKFEQAGLCELAIRYAGIAEECADLAEKLDKGGLDEADGEAIEETFRNHMEGVLDGLDIYSDLTEDDEDDDEMCPECKKTGDECKCPPEKKKKEEGKPFGGKKAPPFGKAKDDDEEDKKAKGK